MFELCAVPVVTSRPATSDSSKGQLTLFANMDKALTLVIYCEKRIDTSKQLLSSTTRSQYLAAAEEFVTSDGSHIDTEENLA